MEKLPELKKMNPLQMWRYLQDLVDEYYANNEEEIKRLEAEENS